MKRHILWAVLLPFAFLAKMMAQPTASTPTAGQSYYIYNVGQKQYMAADSEGKLTLSATGMAIELTQADATVGTWYLTTPSSLVLYWSRRNATVLVCIRSGNWPW